MSRLKIEIDGHAFEIELTLTPQCAQSCQVTVDGQVIRVSVPDFNSPLAELDWMVIDDRPYELAFDNQLRWLRAFSGLHQVEVQDLETRVTKPRSSDGRVKAPIPGLITRILVEEGQAVKAEQPLLILEAMKMENEIRAPFDGQVKAMAVTPGQTVAQHEVLVEVT